MPGALHAIVIMGVSGCGKTTIAEALASRLGWTFLDADRLHPVSNVEKMRSGMALTDDDRRPWLQAIAAEIDQQRASQKPIVTACSALKRAYRTILIGERADVQLIYLKGNRDLIMSRLAPRKDHYFPASLLDSQFATLEEPAGAEHALVVTIDKHVDAIVDEIVDRLGYIR